jgi:hypothetical protein
MPWKDKTKRKEWYAKNKERTKPLRKVWAETYKNKYPDAPKFFYNKRRINFLEMYGNKCACCGETQKEFLTIEHINGQKGKKRESSAMAYAKAIKEYRPDLYTILCMNCNHSKGKYGYCPHEHKKQ